MLLLCSSPCIAPHSPSKAKVLVVVHLTLCDVVPIPSWISSPATSLSLTPLQPHWAPWQVLNILGTLLIRAFILAFPQLFPTLSCTPYWHGLLSHLLWGTLFKFPLLNVAYPAIHPFHCLHMPYTLSFLCFGLNT